MFLKKNQRFLLLGDPPGYVDSMGQLPEGLVLLRELQPPVDIIQVFVKDMAELKDTLARLEPLILEKTVLWICYPKGTSGFKTDINRDIIWRYVQTLSMNANSMISIDSTWSAMRVARV